MTMLIVPISFIFVISVTSLTIGTLAYMESTSDDVILLDGSVTSTKLAEKAVITSTIGDASVDGSKICDFTIAANHIMPHTIIASKIADMAIATDHLQTGCVVSGQ